MPPRRRKALSRRANRNSRGKIYILNNQTKTPEHGLKEPVLMDLGGDLGLCGSGGRLRHQGLHNHDTFELLLRLRPPPGSFAPRRPHRQKADLRPPLDIDHLSRLPGIRLERRQRPGDGGLKPLPLPGVDQRDRQQVRRRDRWELLRLDEDLR